ncbi:MAG: DUF2975 domain-containing protein [Parvularculaceae bacterium]
MRALGKGSLASILAVLLHVTRVILWIAFIGLSIAILTIPFLPILIKVVAGIDSGSIASELDIDADDTLEIIQHFITFGVLIYSINRLLEILKTLRFGSPFVRENAERFTRVGLALLVGEGAKIVLGVISVVVDANVEIEIEMISWLAIAAVFVLAAVFREGARMKEEQDLTV